ncbi:MAG TPA: GvpL/GvpF family gas vesicle protein [Thermoleophilaceae bacterium]|nr:GvpL/GvpF family gas vesicle protein [Thermoleophilaceae bacterium]
MTAGAGALYVYGVMAAAERPSLSLDGIAGSGVATVEHAGLAALTSPVQPDALTAAAAVRAHWSVLQEASHAATVLPLRFGTIVESEAVLRDRLLEPNAERLRDVLDQLVGRVQLTVKGDYDESSLLREVVASSPRISALRERLRKLPAAAAYYDRIRLGELVAEAVARRREADTAHAVSALEPHAVAIRVEDSSQPSAFSLSCLIERSKAQDFDKQVGALAEESAGRIAIRYLGPMPPYSFAEAELETGGETWG